MTWSLAVVGGRLPAPRGGPAPTALAVENGRIARIGTDAEILADADARTEVVDAHGGPVLPGFDDAHIHVLDGGLATARLRLPSEGTVRDVLDAVAEHNTATADDSWILGSGWHYRSFPGGLPDRAALDTVTGERPTYLSSFDGHCVWVNSAALRLAGIDRDTPDPPGGTIVRDAAGDPTGALKERASTLVHPVLPRPTAEELVRALRTAVRALNAAGITSVQDPGTQPDELDTWRRLRDAGELTVRARLGLPMPAGQDPADWPEVLDGYAALLAKVTDPDWLTGGTLKGFVDGVVESRTAALLAPYRDADTAGEPAFGPAELTGLVGVAQRRGWQVQLHAIGDRAVRMALDAYEHARATGPDSALRHRVEHIELLDPADLPRFAGLGAVASMQPAHAFCDPDRIRDWDRLLGPARSATAWPMRQVLRAGGTVALGTDWPVTGHDPLATLRAAVTPSNASLDPADERTVAPSGTPNHLTWAEALDAYTRGSAVAAGAEARRGTLTVGKDADIVVLDRHPRDEGAAVTATIAAGRVVHRGTG